MNMFTMSCDLSDNMEEAKVEIPTPPPVLSHPSGFIQPGDLKASIRIEKPLGKGSFGSVSKIIYLPNGYRYVMKSIGKTSASVRAMAVREAQIGMGINHPNVCKTYAWSEDADKVYIIMEYIEGMDLFDFISKNPGIFQKIPDLFWFVMKCILSGLFAIHEKGFVHCDIKPENIQIGLSPDEKTITCVKIIDFGLSQPIEEIHRCSAGTHDYMAPEVAKDTDKDASLDIWSLGILMYAMLMMRIPSQIQSKNANNARRKEEVIEHLCRLTQDDFKPFKCISSQEKYARIQHFILSCLRVNRTERPSLRELLAKISEFFPPVAVEKKDA